MNKHEFCAKDCLLHTLEAADRLLEYTSGASEGPCPHMADAVESLKGLLIRNGDSHLEVSRSQIPYRNW